MEPLGFEHQETIMKLELSSFARSGLVAFGLLTGLPLAASAGPVGFGPLTDKSIPQATIAPTLVQYCGGNGCRRHYRRDGWSGNGWRRDSWRGDGWRRSGWNGRYYRRYDNDWRWRNFGGSGIYFNFSIPAYRYYEPRYYQPRYYEPRRIYRSGASAHVQWCYDRYRSYRAWDNSFQPYNGPRRQCWSPYS